MKIPEKAFQVALVPHPGEVARIERVNARRLELWAQVKTPQKIVRVSVKSNGDHEILETYTPYGTVHRTHLGSTLNEFA